MALELEESEEVVDMGRALWYSRLPPSYLNRRTQPSSQPIAMVALLGFMSMHHTAPP